MSVEKLIEWTDEFNTGIKEIDKQHKILVELLNQLHYGIRQKQGKQECNRVFGKLIEYTRIHFATEENMLHLINYPNWQKHKKNHEKFLENVLEMKAKFDKTHNNMSLELLHFLKCWLQNHILKSDEEACMYLLQRERREPNYIERLFSRAVG